MNKSSLQASEARAKWSLHANSTSAGWRDHRAEENSHLENILEEKCHNDLNLYYQEY
jgi:hypothetical protein